MNNKGFTLIELVATLALLAVISVISFVSITTVVDNSKVTNCNNLVQNIENAAKEYVSDNRYNSSFDTDNNKKDDINVTTLINNKYLVGPIKNPFNKDETISGDNIIIKIELKNDYSVNKITVYNKNGNNEYVIDCNKGSW